MLKIDKGLQKEKQKHISHHVMQIFFLKYHGMNFFMDLQVVAEFDEMVIEFLLGNLPCLIENLFDFSV